MRIFKLLEEPAFYDFFGLAVFLFITIVSVWSLAVREVLPIWAVIVLLAIGILGLIVDSFNVWRFVTRK